MTSDVYRLTLYLDNGLLVVKDCETREAADTAASEFVGQGCDGIAVKDGHLVMTTVVPFDPASKGRDPYTKAKVIAKGADK